MKQQRIGCVGWFVSADDEYGKTVAVCDIVQSKVDKYVAGHPGARGFTDYREMVDSGEIDLVIISTPNEVHREMAEYCLGRGIHVFLEKPMGVNREELDSILRAQQGSGRHLAIDFELRVSFFGRRIKELIDAGEIGRPVGVEFIHHRGAWQAQGNGVWRTDPARSGGLYFMEICHEIDVFRHWFGEVGAVQSFSIPNVLPQYRDNMPDNVCTHLWFDGGVEGVILASHTSSVFPSTPEQYADLGHDMYFVISGTAGAIRADCLSQKMLLCRYDEHHPDADRGLRVGLNRVEDYSGMASHTFHHDCTGNRQRFIRSMALGEPPHQDAADAWRTHVVCLAAEASAVEQSQRIELSFDGPAT